jgi:hypothetical protein
MAVESKPGPELDRAVAEAIGEVVISREEAVAKCNDWRLRQSTPHGPDFESWFAGEWYLDGQPNSGGLDSLPSYSTDLNAAFAAAEKVGLFDPGNRSDGRSYFRLLQKYEPDMWAMTEIVEEAEHDGFHEPNANEMVLDVGEQATPALAICAAILVLKKA